MLFLIHASWHESSLNWEWQVGSKTFLSSWWISFVHRKMNWRPTKALNSWPKPIKNLYQENFGTKFILHKVKLWANHLCSYFIPYLIPAWSRKPSAQLVRCYFIRMLLVGNITRKIETAGNLSGEVCCCGVWAQHTAVHKEK